MYPSLAAAKQAVKVAGEAFTAAGPLGTADDGFPLTFLFTGDHSYAFLINIFFSVAVETNICILVNTASQLCVKMCTCFCCCNRNSTQCILSRSFLAADFRRCSCVVSEESRATHLPHVGMLSLHEFTHG